MLWEILYAVSVAESMGMQFQPGETGVVLKGVLAFIMTFPSLMCWSSTRTCVATWRVLLRRIYSITTGLLRLCAVYKWKHLVVSILSGKLKLFVQYDVGAQLQRGTDCKKHIMEFIDWYSYIPPLSLLWILWLIFTRTHDKRYERGSWSFTDFRTVSNKGTYTWGPKGLLKSLISGMWYAYVLCGYAEVSF